MKIIGCGNQDRGDDHAGIVVAERLRELGFDAETHSGDALGLIEKWSSDDDVILVDAVVTGAKPGTLQVWNFSRSGSGTVKFAEGATVSSHGFDVAEAIELGRALHRLPSRLRIYGIETEQFDHGTEISEPVRGAILQAVERIRAELSTS